MNSNVNLESAVGASGLLGAGFVLLSAGPAFSLSGAEKVLARGEEKYFREPDCHLAYSVVGVRRSKTPGGAAGAGRETFTRR